MPSVIDWVQNHKTMVILQSDAEGFEKIKNQYTSMGKKYADFFEDDLNHALTATAFEPITDELGSEIFSSYKLI